MEKITTKLVEALSIKIDKQRLDSTHIFSDMANFGRTRLMGVAIKRFLTQLKRHDPKAYELLDQATEEVVCCPAGHKPQSSEHDKETGKTKTVMPESACGQCEFFDQCPVGKIKGRYKLDHTAKERRFAGRRREQDTEVFRERYKTRGGIEGTNSGRKCWYGCAKTFFIALSGV